MPERNERRLFMPDSNTNLPMKEVILITSGDLRLSANQICWAAQEVLERKLTQCFQDAGVSVRRAFPVDSKSGHGFISSQRMGMDIFAGIDPEANLVFATAAWQYSHHVLPGMRTHRGPILTVANWSGQWPGLVGLLNLNGSLVKAGVPFSTLWSKDFTDEYFLTRLKEWVEHRSRRFAGAVASASKHARKNVGNPINHVGVAVSALTDHSNVLGNGGVGGASPLTIDDFVEICRIGGIGRLQHCLLFLLPAECSSECTQSVVV